eukprot:TRINITY_DN24536_c0_g1_i1.p1 TRINITY_DN24536_c0_g1~~TRINITY_DN24536_c0_g1_i1.p1  ORF type:complete len:369 (+),score=150.35 TRINITY_DN24536_c0_g1_i1:64-1107(+)
MQAVCLVKEKAPDGKYQLKQCQLAEPKFTKGAREALIAVSHAALNHRDNWMTKGMYPGIQFGGIIGSDGVGTVQQVSDEGDEGWLGRRVVVDPSIAWGPEEKAPGKDFSILGMPYNGTLSELVRVPAENIHLAPAHLNDEQAAALPLAGATAYRALFTKGHAAPGSVVLIPGIGSGVALFILQFAVATGCKVFVTSSSDEKIQRAVKLGAVGGVNYKQKGWHDVLRKKVKKLGGFDAVVDGAGGPALNQYLRMMRPGGRIVSFGATAGNPQPFVMPGIFLPNIEICGTAMSSPSEFAAMIRFVNEHRIVPIVDSVYPLSGVGDAVNKMRRGALFGKLVIKVAPTAKL